MIALDFLLLVASFTKGVYAANMLKNTEHLNALIFVNNLRVYSIVCKSDGVQLPNLYSHPSAQSLNNVVHGVVKEQYEKFWKDLRRCDYVPDLRRLKRLSKGAAFGVVKRRPDKIDLEHLSKYRGQSEAILLQPILSADNNLKESYRSCMHGKEENILVCLERKLHANEDCKGLNGEMIKSSIWALRVALQISTISWYSLGKWLEDLRSDKYALRSIRNWDFNTVIPQILYLKFRLYARQLIAHISGNIAEEALVSKMQKDLERAIQDEFCLAMIKELKIEDNINGSITYHDIQTEPIILAVREIRLIIVNRPDMSKRRAFLYLDDNHTLYFSVGDYLLESERDELDDAFNDIIQNIKKEILIFNDNPMIYCF